MNTQVTVDGVTVILLDANQWVIAHTSGSATEMGSVSQYWTRHWRCVWHFLAVWRSAWDCCFKLVLRQITESVFLHISSFSSWLCLVLQLSGSRHAAVLPARWTNCPPHWRLQSRSLDGDLPWVTQLQGADTLPGHHVSAYFSPLIYPQFTRVLTGRPKQEECGSVFANTCTDFQCKFSCLSSYCSPEYTFPRQEEVISFAASTAFELVTLNSSTLVVCGSYSVGKEKVFLGKCWVHVMISASVWPQGPMW